MELFGPPAGAWLEYLAGRPISAAGLQRCRRVDFVEHPYENIPADASDSFRTHHGAQWLVRYCKAGDMLEVEVFVAAQGLASSLDSLGEFRVNTPLASFSMRGVPLAAAHVESSEGAVRAIFTQNPRPVTDVPRMVRLSRNWVTWAISWTVTQSLPDGSRSSVTAMPIGTPAHWLIRPADSAAVEVDSLWDYWVEPNVQRAMRRRRDAVTSIELPQSDVRSEPARGPAATFMLRRQADGAVLPSAVRNSQAAPGAEP